jgi:hypothetical protein
VALYIYFVLSGRYAHGLEQKQTCAVGVGSSSTRFPSFPHRELFLLHVASGSRFRSFALWGSISVQLDIMPSFVSFLSFSVIFMIASTIPFSAAAASDSTCSTLKARLRVDDELPIAKTYCSSLLSIPVITETIRKTSIFLERVTSTETRTSYALAEPSTITTTLPAASTTFSTVTETATEQQDVYTEWVYNNPQLCTGRVPIQPKSLQKRQDPSTKVAGPPPTPAAFSGITDPSAASAACSCIRIATSKVKETQTVTVTKAANKPVTETQLTISTSTPIDFVTETKITEVVTERTTITSTVTAKTQQTVTSTTIGDSAFPTSFNIGIDGNYVQIDQSNGDALLVENSTAADTFEFWSYQSGIGMTIIPTSGEPSYVSRLMGSILPVSQTCADPFTYHSQIWAGLDDNTNREELLPVQFAFTRYIERPSSNRRGWYPLYCE